jgi:hypothetical protein
MFCSLISLVIPTPKHDEVIKKRVVVAALAAIAEGVVKAAIR